MYGYLCQARKIDKGQVKDVRTIYPQVNGEFANALVLSGYAEGLLLDLLTDFVEVREAFVDVQELAPLSV